MNEDLEKYKMEHTCGVLLVNDYEFAKAVVDNYLRGYNKFDIKEFDKYYALNANHPNVKYGYYYTLLLEKDKCSLINLIPEIIWQMNEIHREEKKKILDKLHLQKN